MNTEDLDATTVELSVDGAVYKIVMPDMASDYIQNRVATELEPYELEMLRDMKSHLSATDLVLDIGANIGNHTFYLAEVVGCKVVAFEPNESLVTAMQQSVQLNNNSNRVVIESCALGEESNICEFEKLIPENIGSQKLVCGHGDMQVRTLDEFTFNEPVKMLKIDVEGMELEVLKGAKKLIACDAPIIYVEALELSDFEVLHGFFADLEYTYLDTFNATPTHVFVPASKLNLSGDMFKSSHFKSASKSYDIRSLQGKYKNVSILNASLNESLSREKLKRSAEQSGLQEESEKRRFKLDEANKKYKGLCENYTDLKKNFEKAELRHKKVAVELEAKIEKSKLDCDEKERELGRLQSELVNQTLELGEAKSACNEKDRELDRLQSELVNQTFELEEATLAGKEKDNKLGQLKSEIKKQGLKNKTILDEQNELRDKLNRANRLYRDVTGSLDELKAKHRDSLNVYGENGLRWLEPVANLVGPIPSLSRYVARRCTRLAKSAYVDDNFSRLFLASLAWRLDPKPYRQKWYGFQLYKAGLMVRATEVLDIVRGEVRFSESEERIYQNLVANHCGARLIHHENDSNRIPKKNVIEAATFSVDRPIAELKIACVMDDFTYHSFAPECILEQLAPESWEQHISNISADMLFVESAWRGVDEKWAGKVNHNSSELRELIDWCRKKKIPTVFWNKEDPVHFNTFLTTAAQFDYVFTTDLDCLGGYKRALGHDRVYFLPFACQPKMHNPIEIYKRKDAFCFAGAYYARYPERTNVLDNFTRIFPDYKPLEIYDRNFGKENTDYKFPEAYAEYIVGTLPFNEIDKAYKGYNYAINLNSIINSQTMFARRVYELLASNTITVSNYSKSLDVIFGSLIFSSDCGKQIVERLIVMSEQDKSKVRLAGLRKVMSEHTYQDRLAYVASKMGGQVVSGFSPLVILFGYAESKGALNNILDSYKRQTYINSRLIIVMSGEKEVSGHDTVRYLHVSEAKRIKLSALVEGSDYVGLLAHRDYYGENYLKDLLLASRYVETEIVGKSTYYQLVESNVVEKINARPYTFSNQLNKYCSVIKAGRFLGGSQTVSTWLQAVAVEPVYESGGFCVDPFNYCKNGLADDKEFNRVRVMVDDISGLDIGTPVGQLQSAGEKVLPARDVEQELDSQTGSLFSKLFSTGNQQNISFSVFQDCWQVNSELESGKHTYLYQKADHKVADLNSIVDGILPLHLDIDVGLNIRWVTLFFDAKMNRLSHVIVPANQNHSIRLPEKTMWLRFGLRIFGSGRANIRKVIFGHKQSEPISIVKQSQILLLTNNYPSYADLYKNAFVHRRVLGYKKSGLDVDVFRMKEVLDTSFHEFESIKCTTGSSCQLDYMLSQGSYNHVLVHFLDDAMWAVLKKYINKVKVTVWLHGAEIQSYHRRSFLYENENVLRKAKVLSDYRSKFWLNIFSHSYPNLNFIFVSKHFAGEVMEDLDVNLNKDKFQIIHNPIDTTLFDYSVKSGELRKKILMIRPFVSKVYANDLAVKAIERLSQYEWFQDLSFTIVGDGVLFDETVEPLRDLPNVRIEQCFLQQDEIAELHKAHGIFLCPSRMDTQGVSRDEAMSSGLVPITNSVGAIPDFVTDESCMLAAAEDFIGIATAVEELYFDENLFLNMSRAAQKNVRENRSLSDILVKELKVINDD